MVRFTKNNVKEYLEGKIQDLYKTDVTDKTKTGIKRLNFRIAVLQEVYQELFDEEYGGD